MYISTSFDNFVLLHKHNYNQDIKYSDVAKSSLTSPPLGNPRNPWPQANTDLLSVTIPI